MWQRWVVALSAKSDGLDAHSATLYTDRERRIVV